jgi:hypothetical protein
MDDSSNEERKAIKFIGKHTIDVMTNPKQAKRTEMSDIDDKYFTYEEQIKLINQMFLDQKTPFDKPFKREIVKKINGYKSQDIDKKIYDSELLISLNDTIEKLVCSKLLCVYCKENVLIFYKQVREPKQWTLDRIDNNLCHSNENTIISCLKCNLQRRTRDMNKFLNGKQLKIKKY